MFRESKRCRTPTSHAASPGCGEHVEPAPRFPPPAVSTAEWVALECHRWRHQSWRRPRAGGSANRRDVALPPYKAPVSVVGNAVSLCCGSPHLAIRRRRVSRERSSRVAHRKLAAANGAGSANRRDVALRTLKAASPGCGEHVEPVLQVLPTYRFDGGRRRAGMSAWAAPIMAAANGGDSRIVGL